MDLRECPYDGTPIEIERVAADASLVICPGCGARWEWHNALLRRLHEPDLRAVRQIATDREVVRHRSDRRSRVRAQVRR